VGYFDFFPTRLATMFAGFGFFIELDIIDTLMIPRVQDLAGRDAIVLIRTFPGFSLYAELKSDQQLP
jgi:uncharacterized membrane protein